MKWGDKEKFLRSVEEKTNKTPSALKAQVHIDEILAPIIECFDLLFRGEPIPLSEIIQYCKLQGVYDVQRFFKLIKVAEYTILKETRKT